jgi:hypothetical protein
MAATTGPKTSSRAISEAGSSRHGDVGACLAHRLAGVTTLQKGQFLGVAPHQFANSTRHRRPVDGGRA